jgi:threonine-phosphate decarboxylase
VSETAAFAGPPEHAPDWREILDLSINVNPLGPPPSVRTAIKRAIDRIIFYPERSPRALAEALAAEWRLLPEQILLGNGVTELVYFLARVWQNEPAALAIPALPEVLQAYPYAHRVSWSDRSSWPEEGLLLLSQPNHATGQAVPFDRLRDWLLATRNPVLIDESFLDFSDQPSAATLLERRPNLFVLRSLSPLYAIPGLRIGALIASEAAVAHLAERRHPWAIDVVAEAAARACLEDKEHAARSRQLVRDERDWLWTQFPSIPALAPLSSDANFYLAYVPGGAAQLCRWFGERKVILRNATGWPGIEGEAVRFAVRTRAENERFLAMMKEYFCG